MNEDGFWFIMITQWFIFAIILAFSLFVMFMYMDTRNLKKEQQYMRNYTEAVSGPALQRIMCNGSPVG